MRNPTTFRTFSSCFPCYCYDVYMIWIWCLNCTSYNFFMPASCNNLPYRHINVYYKYTKHIIIRIVPAAIELFVGARTMAHIQPASSRHVTWPWLMARACNRWKNWLVASTENVVDFRRIMRFACANACGKNIYGISECWNRKGFFSYSWIVVDLCSEWTEDAAP